MSNLKSAVLTPPFILAFVIAAVWCSGAISAIADGEDTEAWLAVLIGLPLFVALIGFGIARMATEDRATEG